MRQDTEQYVDSCRSSDTQNQFAISDNQYANSENQNQYANSENQNQYANSDDQYANSFVLAAAKGERSSTTDGDGNQCQAFYQDLNVDDGSAEPSFYDTITPRVLPKPARRTDRSYLSLCQ